jgi:hypothetical protein
MRLSNNLGNDTGNGMAVPTVCSVGTLFRIPHFLRKDVCAVSYAVQTTSRLQACHVSPAFLHVIVYNLKINLLHAWHPVQPGRRVLRTVLTCDISSDHSKHNDVSRVPTELQRACGRQVRYMYVYVYNCKYGACGDTWMFDSLDYEMGSRQTSRCTACYDRYGTTVPVPVARLQHRSGNAIVLPQSVHTGYNQ